MQSPLQKAEYEMMDKVTDILADAVEHAAHARAIEKGIDISSAADEVLKEAAGRARLEMAKRKAGLN